jgi:hypothetical protein
MAEIQQPSKGYGSYLTGIIPPDIAVAAGAFSAAMQQIQNIQEVQIEKFAQVVTNLETMAGLNTNSNSNNLVPTNLPLRTLGRPKIALGSGPQGSYTMSDFFGCMSGLPYNGPLSNIYAKLNEVATRKLFNIYHETYLAVTYARARLKNVTQPVYYVNIRPYRAPGTLSPTDPGQSRIDDWYYTLTFAYDSSNKGGGYGRGTAVPPEITISPNNVGASATTTIGTDDNDIQAGGTGNFGRVKSVSANFGTPYKYDQTDLMQENAPDPPAIPTNKQETVSIALPPIDYLPVQANGNFSTSGVNVLPGWSKNAYTGNVDQGPAQWPGINDYIQQYINQANTEIDAILLAKPAQCKSLNNSWNATGAQLTIEQRARQEGLRPPLDNGIAPGFGVANPATRENFLSLYPTTIYTFVDSVPQYGKNTEPHMYAQTIENIANWDTIGGQSLVGMMRENRNQSRLTALGISLDNNINDTLPYDQQKVLIANGTLPTGLANPNIPSGSTTANPNDPFIPNTTIPSTPVVILDGVEIVPQPPGNINVVTGEYVITNPDVGGLTELTNPNGLTNPNLVNQQPGLPIDIGLSEIPGSFAGSPYTDLIPPNLNAWYTSSTLMPSTYTVNEAIDEVVRCNCDCWNLA